MKRGEFEVARRKYWQGQSDAGCRLVAGDLAVRDADAVEAFFAASGLEPRRPKGPVPWEPEEPSVNLHATTDALAWAREFVRMHGGDEGLMLSWFANAIMTGFDEGRRRAQKDPPPPPERERSPLAKGIYAFQDDPGGVQLRALADEPGRGSHPLTLDEAARCARLYNQSMSPAVSALSWPCSKIACDKPATANFWGAFYCTEHLPPGCWYPPPRP